MLFCSILHPADHSHLFGKINFLIIIGWRNEMRKNSSRNHVFENHWLKGGASSIGERGGDTLLLCCCCLPFAVCRLLFAVCCLPSDDDLKVGSCNLWQANAYQKCLEAIGNVGGGPSSVIYWICWRNMSKRTRSPLPPHFSITLFDHSPYSGRKKKNLPCNISSKVSQWSEAASLLLY